MNIVQIIPGSGGSFYCGNCLRDSKYYEALKKEGHQVIKIPMYLPLFSDEHDITDIPVFYGAVSIYLRQQYAIFRKIPVWFDRFLNSKPVLKLAAGMAGSTRAEGLEDMTISMLLGEDGLQKNELDRMVEWIGTHCKPDVIHISNALLLGLAHKIKYELGVPVFCSLQDEDVWVDGMKPEFREKVWDLMHEKSKDVDLFISVSDFYADVSIQRMRLDTDKIETVHLGVDPQDYKYRNVKQRPKNIGYISRMCYDNGLDILVDAFIDMAHNEEFEHTNLIITGGSTGDDKSFLKNIKRKIKKANLNSRIEFHPDFEGEEREKFYEKVSLISVPVRKGEAFGIYLTEAMACGIPVLQPKLGAFPEIVKKSGGGTIYEENNPKALSLALQKMLKDEEKLESLSLNARKSILGIFNIHEQTKNLIEIYERFRDPEHIEIIS